MKLGRPPLFRLQWNLSNTDTLGSMKCVLIRKVSSFQGANNTYLHVHEAGTWSSVLIREVSLVQGCPLTLRGQIKDTVEPKCVTMWCSYHVASMSIKNYLIFCYYLHGNTAVIATTHYCMEVVTIQVCSLSSL